jgi:hypothetical protein
VPWSKAVARRAVRAMIGQEMRARYEVPQDLPHEMLTFPDSACVVIIDV